MADKLTKKHRQALDKERCCECGVSVTWGSGNFVNRVPVFDDYTVRRENNSPYPDGAYLCALCDYELFGAGPIQRAFQRALKEQKQPICPSCGHPLEIIQYQSTILRWSWNEQAKTYQKTEGGDADAPFCSVCGAEDWNFTAATAESPELHELCEQLGLDY